jgi:hypothetical protein
MGYDTGSIAEEHQSFFNVGLCFVWFDWYRLNNRGPFSLEGLGPPDLVALFE